VTLPRTADTSAQRVLQGLLGGARARRSRDFTECHSATHGRFRIQWCSGYSGFLVAKVLWSRCDLCSGTGVYAHWFRAPFIAILYSDMWFASDQAASATVVGGVV
jgi:hypothetical protein